ncbi:hypothetical protein IGI04_037335, partial [Brassica rapa subsp. trilocularis]
MESHIDGVVFLATDFVQKDEKKDERVDRILDMINRKHDWNNHVWGVKEATNSEFEESGEEKGEDQTADTERDRGAESRKKNVLCHLAASSKGNIDIDMKNFLEDLVQASFTTFGKKFCQQFSDRLGKIETEVTQLRTASERTEQFETVVTDRLGKIKAEVTQLRTTLVVTELVGKSDQASGPSMTKINIGPSTSRKDTAPSKKKVFEARLLELGMRRSIKRLSVFLSVLHIDQDRPTDRPFNIQIDRSKRSGHHSLFKGLIDSDLLTKLISYENSTKFSQTES